MTIEEKLKFIADYKQASNAATGSKIDANANVTEKNIGTLATELDKPDHIELQRAVMKNYLTADYGAETAQQYEDDLAHHIIYRHDETTGGGGYPYCVAMSMYPFLLSGLKEVGGNSEAPQHIESFIGGFCNLMFIVAAQFAGAVASPEFLTYFDHFLRKDYGEDYYLRLNEVVEHRASGDLTLRQKIEGWFGQVVYTINQPAAARGYQSIFWNIAYFDRYYFQSIYDGFVFPDGDEPCWESTKILQKVFMKWFNAERLKNILTFPVETANILVENKKYKDEEMADFFAEMWSEGASFFMYQSDSVDALSSCCRLRNAVEKEPFSYTLGAGGVETGSKAVITMNLNRMVQDWNREGRVEPLTEYVRKTTNRIHKYLTAFNHKLWDDYNSNLLTIFKAGFIDLDKQYLTVGINGFVEAAEFLGIKVDPFNEDYKKLAHDILNTIERLNQAERTDHERFNLEFVPSHFCGHLRNKISSNFSKTHMWQQYGQRGARVKLA